MKALPLVLAAVLAVVLVLQWKSRPRLPTSSAPATPAAASAPAAPPELENLGLDAASFDVISRRPLFVQGRRPQDQDGAGSDPSSDATDLDGVVLKAILITPTQRTAWLRDGNGKESRQVQVGDTVRGWTVAGIERDALQLKNGGRDARIELRIFKAPGPPAAAPVPRPRRFPPRLIRPPRMRTQGH